MSVAVACPKCQSRYQVPENAIGKRVKCKKCGHVFAATAHAQMATAQTATSQTATVKSAAQKAVATSASPILGSGNSPATTVAPEKLAQFGIDGPLKRPAEIFQSGLAPPPRDILGNHAADPGFLKGDEIAARRAQKAEEEGVETEDELAQIINNPHARQSNIGKKKTGNAGQGNKKKKKKKQAKGSGITEYISSSYLSSAAIFVVLGIGFFAYLSMAEDGSEVVIPRRLAGVYEKFGEIGVLVGFLTVAFLTLIVGIVMKRFGKDE